MLRGDARRRSRALQCTVVGLGAGAGCKLADVPRCVPQDLCQHPFWQVRLPLLELPPEPALEAFIARFNLAPTVEELRQSTRDGLKVGMVSGCSPTVLELQCGMQSYRVTGA